MSELLDQCRSAHQGMQPVIETLRERVRLREATHVNADIALTVEEVRAYIGMLEAHGRLLLNLGQLAADADRISHQLVDALRRERKSKPRKLFGFGRLFHVKQ